MEPDQVHIVPAAVSGRLEQVLDAVEPRLARQIAGHVGDPDRHDRVHHDVAIIHAVTPAGFDTGLHPDADAAADPPAPDSLAKVTI